MYFVSRRSLNSSRKSEFGDSGHCRISTSDVSKIAADRPLSKMRQYANDPLQPYAIFRSSDWSTSVTGRSLRSTAASVPCYSGRSHRRLAPPRLAGRFQRIRPRAIDPIAVRRALEKPTFARSSFSALSGPPSNRRPEATAVWLPSAIELPHLLGAGAIAGR